MLAKRFFCHQASCKWLDLKTFFKTLNAPFLKENFGPPFSFKNQLKSLGSQPCFARLDTRKMHAANFSGECFWIFHFILAFSFVFLKEAFSDRIHYFSLLIKGIEIFFCLGLLNWDYSASQAIFLSWSILYVAGLKMLLNFSFCVKRSILCFDKFQCLQINLVSTQKVFEPF